jgi:hypothetical protein
MSDQPYQPYTSQPNPGQPATPPAPVNSDRDEVDNLDARIAAAVEARVAGIASDYDRKIRALEARQNAALKSARGLRAVDHLVPTHAGGPGNDIHETWGQYYQELSEAGLLTHAHTNTTNGIVPEEAEAEDVNA